MRLNTRWRRLRTALTIPARRALLGAALVVAGGCADSEPGAFARKVGSAPVAAELTATPAPAAAPGAPGDAEVPARLPRKIIFNAQVTLVVESVTKVGQRLEVLVKEAGGYVSETDLSSYTHTQRQATWKVRVPVERFDRFLDDVNHLGELQQSHVDSQDVTQEYYDTEARITNKRKEEERLLKHLADSTGKLEDILAVERELSRVRGEIETMQGRVRYLANMTALSTLTLTANEAHNYAPPVAPTFATEIARTFQGSFGRLVDVAKGFILLVVAVAPWLPLIVLLALPVVVWGRRYLRASRRVVESG